MDEEQRRKELRMLVASVRSHFISLAMPSMNLMDILREYKKQESKELPFAKYGYTDPESFLIREAGFQRMSNGSLTYSSAESKHITEMIESQKTKPRMAAPPSSRSSFRPNPMPIRKLSPAPNRSNSASILGNTVAPMPSFSRSTSQSLHSTSASAVRSFPTINEMSVFFKQAHEFYAGREVSMNEYLAKVGDLGSCVDSDVAAWLRAQRFDMATFYHFIKEKLNLPLDVVPGKNAIFIRSPPRTERPPSLPARAADSNDLSLLKHEPFSIAYKMERLPLGNGSIDIEVNCFDLQAPNFHFTLIETSQRRLELMKRLRQHEHALLPRERIERGAPCIVTGENNAFFRATILKVGELFVDVYYVDFGESNSVPIDGVYRISDEYLGESIYAYPATMANVRPVDGSATFKMKTLQDISIELAYSCVKATILRFNENSKKYEVDLGEAAMALQREGLLIYNSAKPSPVVFNGFQQTTVAASGTQHTAAPTNGILHTAAATNGHASSNDLSKITVENRVLPNCETIAIIQRASSCFVLSSDVSRVLGLAQDTFLSTLEKYRITVTESWKPSPEVLEKLKAGGNNVEQSAGDVFIPVAAVAPLLRAYLWIEGKTLDNEKNVLKAFFRMAN